MVSSERLARGGAETVKPDVSPGVSPDDRLVEVVEVADHPWFVGCQFHPEFASTPFRPHPLFVDFVGAALLHASGRS